MLGILGTLDMARRGLQTQLQAMSVTGHNIANVSNPTYSRQRVAITTSVTIPTRIGSMGTGADVTAINQLRSVLLDAQIQKEASITGFWTAQQTAFSYGEAALGQQIDRTGTDTNVGSVSGLANGIASLFSSIQSLTTDPASLAERQLVLSNAQDLASRFNAVAQRLDNLSVGISADLATDVTNANELLDDIAQLNEEITLSELSMPGTANDLRDTRQQKLEQLAALVPITSVEQPDGSVNVSINGVSMVDGVHVTETLETYDAGGGQMLVRTVTSGTPLTLTGGHMQGLIDARDGTLAATVAGIDDLAAQLITAFNALHQSGYGTTGTTGAAFFTGTDAHDIGVNGALIADARLLQASGAAGEPGNNQVALALAQLNTQPQAALGNQTFTDRYAELVSGIGQALANANSELADQEVVVGMMEQQRQSISGVSLDEELANLTKFQYAYEANARMMSVLDEIYETLVNIKR